MLDKILKQHHADQFDIISVYINGLMQQLSVFDSDYYEGNIYLEVFYIYNNSWTIRCIVKLVNDGSLISWAYDYNNLNWSKFDENNHSELYNKFNEYMKIQIGKI